MRFILFGEIVEKVKNPELVKYVELHKLIHHSQYGLWQQRSPTELSAYAHRLGESLVVALDIQSS